MEKLYSLNERVDSIAKNYGLVEFRKRGLSNFIPMGYLQKPLQFTNNPNYQTFYDVSSKLNALPNALSSAGANIFNQGIFSRQFYTGKDSHIKLELTTKIVPNVTNNNNLNTSQYLADIMTMFSPPFVSTYTALKTGVGVVVDTTSGLVGAGIRAGADFALDVVRREGFENTVTNLNNNIASIVNRLDKNVMVFDLRIGNIFNGDDMVVKRFNIILSQDIKADGQPAWLEISSQFETREVVTDATMGKYFNRQSENRVKEIVAEGIDEVEFQKRYMDSLDYRGEIENSSPSRPIPMRLD